LKPDTPLCPSAQFDGEGANVFGIVGGDQHHRRIIYLKSAIPASAIDVNTFEGVPPGEVVRVAAPCAKSACAHHSSETSRCTLAQRIVADVAPNVEGLAYCAIRTQCVWWAQEQAAACKRCSLIVREDRLPSPAVAEARVPPADRLKAISAEARQADVP